jgi:signal transduction histidine kinase
VPPTFANPQQISAVLYDLMNNAAAAIDGPGRVEVSCQEEHRSIRITISDTGRGIPPERLASIFDPSFQTAAGRVSSANWSMFNARQVIREHGGDIRIESKPGSGTAVTVTLPVRGR